MKVEPYQNIKTTHGSFFLFYGKGGVGKTASSLISTPLPVCYIRVENRNFEHTLIPIRVVRPEIDDGLGLAQYDDVEGLMEFLCCLDNFTSYTSVVFDSLSDFMIHELKPEIASQVYEASNEKQKSKKTLIAKNKMTKEGYGSISDLSERVWNQLANISQMGKYVIATARVTSRPTWDRTLEAAPQIAGKAFYDAIDGPCDFIGYVSDKFIEKDGRRVRVFPPRVQFESPDNNFMCKITNAYNEETGRGVKPVGPLDVQAIIDSI